MPSQKDTLRSLFDAVKIPLIAVELKTAKIIAANEAAAELSGYPAKKMESRLFIEYFKGTHAERIQSAIELLQNSPRTPSLVEHDLKLKRKSGRTISVDITLSNYSSNNKKIAIISLHDLSEEKHNQTQRTQAMKQLTHLSKLADIGVLAAGVAHELNNPLMIIQGFAENLELLFSGKEAIDRQEFHSQMSEILKATDRMAKIISKMTRIVRNDDFKIIPVDLRDVAEDILKLFMPQFRADSIDLETHFAESNMTKCDPNQVEQVIINILTNAIHALKERTEGRRIVLRTFVVENEIHLEIWNNGPEIPHNIRDKIMSPFFTTKEVGKGTGLGLALSHGIISAHGGQLTFDSTASGTQFTIQLTHEPMSTIATDFKAFKVLIVDDEAAAGEVLANKLKAFGYLSHTVQSGQEALQLLHDCTDISAVFVDMHMPLMNGRELIHEIRNRYKDKFIIVGVSGYTPSRFTEFELRRLGIHEFLSKPIDANAFSAIITRLEATSGSLAA